MPYLKTVFFCFVFLFCRRNCHAVESFSIKANEDSRVISSTGILLDSVPDFFPADSIKQHKKENKKLIAAVLSFPFPFGVMGLHRIYLGTKPYIPFVYIGTVGGCFGILPLIDFITVLTTKREKIKNYENSKKVFMWLH